MIADNQFAPLGLVLLGYLARIYKIICGSSTTTTTGAQDPVDKEQISAGDALFELEPGERLDRLPGTFGLDVEESKQLRDYDREVRKREQSPDLGEAVPRQEYGDKGGDLAGEHDLRQSGEHLLAKSSRPKQHEASPSHNDPLRESTKTMRPFVATSPPNTDVPTPEREREGTGKGAKALSSRVEKKKRGAKKKSKRNAIEDIFEGV